MRLRHRRDWSAALSRNETQAGRPEDHDITAPLLRKIVVEAFSKSIEDRVPRLGAALAFYMTFSLAPLLLVVVAIAGIVFGRQAAEGRLLIEMTSLVGETAAATLQTLIAAAGRQGSGLTASITGGMIVLAGAVGLFVELQDALNTVLEVETQSSGGLWRAVRDRLFSFLLVLSSAVLLLGMLIFSMLVSAIDGVLGGIDHLIPTSFLLAYVIPACVSFIVITVLFAMIYRVLPDARIRWRDIWFGSIVTSMLFTAGKVLLGLYLGRAAVASLYGAAGSLIVLMLWNYYTAQIFLFGAELMKAYARNRRVGDSHAAESVNA